MAEISQIKLPNNTVLGLKDAKKTGIYTVIGTQTAATGAWTGVLDLPALYAGLTIMYYLPWAGSGNATLNLTLSDGTTTGAKNCYYSASRLTTHYGKGCNIVMTYWPAGSIKIDGTATTDDRWIANANYNTDSDANAMHIRYYNNVLAKEALTAEKVIVGDTDGYRVAASGITFNTSFPILWTTAAVAKNASNYANMYEQIYDRNIANVKSGFSSAANKAIYLIVTISGNIATIDSNILTDTLPSTDDGKVYIRLGKLGANSTGSNYFLFEPVHPKFWYKNGAVREYITDSATVTGHTVAKDVPSNAVFTDHTYSGTGLISVNASTGVISTTATANTGTITSVKTTAGAHTAINVTSGAANFNVPTKTSHLTNDSGFITTDTNNRRAFYGTCSTAGATAAKVVTLSNTTGWELVAGTIVGIRFSNDNTATNVTLNVNSSGAKSIYYKNAVYTGKDGGICGYANHTTYYMYDGTYWAFLSQAVVDSNTDTKVTQTADDSTNSAFEVLMSATADNTTRTETAKKSSKLKFNPSTGNLTASGDIYAGASTGIENSNKLVTGADIYSAGLAPINYSTSEQNTGQKWIDGKDIYQITVDFGALPNNTTKDVTCTGMGTNVSEVIEITGLAKTGNTGTFIPLCYTSGGNDANWYKWPILYFMRKNDSHYETIRLTTYTDRSSSTAYFTIKYTKNS